jgi:hypothetical protein
MKSQDYTDNFVRKSAWISSPFAHNLSGERFDPTGRAGGFRALPQRELLYRESRSPDWGCCCFCSRHILWRADWVFPIITVPAFYTSMMPGKSNGTGKKFFFSYHDPASISTKTFGCPLE